MKRMSLLLSAILVLVIAFIGTVRSVSATADEWNTGTDVSIDLAVNPAPATWMQLFGNGVKVDSATTICHPFREGGYGWTPVIHQLTGNGWVALETSNTRANDESEYQACAMAPTAGTYALFMYYTKPANESACQYDTSEWQMLYWDASEDPMYPDADGFYLYASTPGLPFGTTVTYKLLEGFDGLVVAAKGSAISYDYKDFGIGYADFMASPFVAYVDGSATFQISAGGCKVESTLDISATEFDPCSVGDGC